MSKLNLSLLCVLSAVGLFIVNGCSKTTDVGLSLVELERASILKTDTMAVTMQTTPTLPFVTSAATRWACGAYTDPIFGLSQNSLYFNFRIPTTSLNFANSTLDSLVLCVAYDSVGHYGDALTSPSTSIQNWEVLQLAEALQPAFGYKSDTFFTLGNTLATTQFAAKFRDSVLVGTTNTAPHLRIRLDNSLGNAFLNPTDPNVYLTNQNFKAFFKGICLRPQASATNTSILRFLPKSAQTKLVLYYTQTENGTATAKEYAFKTDDDAESVVIFKHDYSGTAVLNNNATDSLVYVQGNNGVQVKVQFPNIRSLGRIMVNKAELIFYSTSLSNTVYPIPYRLGGAVTNTTGGYNFVDDLVTSLSSVARNYALFGGAADSLATGNFRYKMNISQFMQRIVDNEVADSAMYIQSLSVLESNRVVLANSKHSQLKAYLNLTYTKLD